MAMQTPKTEIYACGNNAWRQLELFREDRPNGTQFETENQLFDTFEEPEDFLEFRNVLSVDAEDVKVLGIWAGLSWSVVKTSSHIYHAGQFDQKPPIPPDSNLHLMGISGNGTCQTSEDFLAQDLKVKQLVANQTCWTVLCDDGSVWSWGDERFPGCLGREVDDENPSSKPTVINVLLPSNINSTITKIASGGYVTAALTSDHDIYIWGSPDPAASRSIIPDLSGDPTPLLIPNPSNPAQEFDFLDIGIGAKHMIVLTTNQRIFVIGNNTNGQLGHKQEFVAHWKEVSVDGVGTKRVVGVAAGGHASFVVVEGMEGIVEP